VVAQAVAKRKTAAARLRMQVQFSLSSWMFSSSAPA
jgi:hypothetical protein